MSAISQAATASFTSQESSGQTGASGDAYGEIDLDGFLKLMIAEMQNLIFSLF